jgi:Undecaprenyl-phosphate galactose phosphotransferase WbaP
MSPPRQLAPAEVAAAQAPHPRITVLLLAASDVFALIACNALAVWGYWLIRGKYAPSFYFRFWPCLILFPLVYEFAGLYHGVALYPGVALEPAEELRRTSCATALAYILLGSATFLSKSGPMFSRGAFLMAWTLSLVAVPLARGALRRLCCHRPWWGMACVIMGDGRLGHEVSEWLTAHPEYGLRPVRVLGDHVPQTGEDYAECGVRYAILAEPDLDRHRLLEFLENEGRHFPHVLTIPDLHGISGWWFSARDLGPAFALEVRRNLLLPFSRACKLAGDLVLVVLLAPFLGVLGLLLALLVKVSSRGPVLFRQMRIGHDGKPFAMLKFRTMVVDGDRVLEEYFCNHPAERDLWELERKLPKDPRVTAVGRLLRVTSLDELPQVLNILRGDMSLVGPRPIVAAEIPKYGDTFALYTQVRPGLTGLWQVSGRNDLTFQERVALDAYYVRKWSFWLDLYILLRTPRTIITREGAY